MQRLANVANRIWGAMVLVQKAAPAGEIQQCQAKQSSAGPPPRRFEGEDLLMRPDELDGAMVSGSVGRPDSGRFFDRLADGREERARNRRPRSVRR